VSLVVVRHEMASMRIGLILLRICLMMMMMLMMLKVCYPCGCGVGSAAFADVVGDRIR
jgi:hypothetical protein